MDWTITATIITLVLASITAIGVWLGPRWTENTRRGYEARQSHLARLKEGVIRPLLHQLTYYDAIRGEELSQGTHLPIGQGEVDFKELLTHFNVDTNVYAALEVRGSSQGIVDSLANLRALL